MSNNHRNLCGTIFRFSEANHMYIGNGFLGQQQQSTGTNRYCEIPGLVTFFFISLVSVSQWGSTVLSGFVNSHQIFLLQLHLNYLDFSIIPTCFSGPFLFKNTTVNLCHVRPHNFEI